MLHVCFLGHARHRDSDSTSFQSSTGVSLADEETIFTSMELFCTRVRNMLDIINTLAQFGKLCEAVKDLPRLPPGQALATDEEITGEDDVGDEDQTGDIPPTISETSFEEGIDTMITLWGGGDHRKVPGRRRDAKDNIRTTWKCRRYLSRWIFTPFSPRHNHRCGCTAASNSDCFPCMHLKWAVISYETCLSVCWEWSKLRLNVASVGSVVNTQRV